jgi:rubrerythrin
MAEYIDREALLNSKDWQALQNYDKARAKAIILGQHAADVVEVRHGEWIEHKRAEESEGLLISNFECSLCHGWERKESDYCPNCGAKMDGKGE